MLKSNCKCCGNQFEYRESQTRGIFCSMVCTHKFQKEEKRQNFLNGKIVGRKHLKNHLVDAFGWKCVVCENEKWMGKPIPLEVDHIDGNAGNNHPTNLRLLCPNCHAQTPTHKAKNKGNGRGSRGLPWY